MKGILIRYGAAVLFAAVLVGGLAVMSHLQPVRAAKEEQPPASGPKFTVVETEGHNLLVTDNSRNVLFFYTVDKGQPVGSELKLRGKIDLNEVGKDSLKPTALNIQK